MLRSLFFGAGLLLAGLTTTAQPTGNTSKGHIAMVMLRQLSRTSGAEPNGYFNGQASVPMLNRCAKAQITLIARFPQNVTNRTRYWNVLMDINRNGSYNDPGERLLTNYQTTNDQVNATNLIIPATLQATSDPATRPKLRVVMTDAAINGAVPNSGPIGFGEVEEYAVNIGAATPLTAPANVRSRIESPSAVVISWDPVVNATRYLVTVQKPDRSEYNVTVQNQTAARLTLITAGATYKAKVQAFTACDGSPQSDYHDFSIPTNYRP